MGAVQGAGQLIKQNCTMFPFSVIEEIGFAVFAAAHDFELGVVASVKLVLLEVPGHGHPEVLTAPDPVMIPLAVLELAAIGYNPWWLVALMSLALLCDEI